MVELNATTAQEAIEQAGLNWEVQPIELFTGELQSVDSHKGIKRADTGEILGVVGKNYTPIQNTDAFAFFDTIVEEFGAKYRYGGEIKGGKRIFLQAQLNHHDFEIGNGGDQISTYITLANSHDGSGSFKAFFTPIRLFCANQLNRALKHAQTTVSLRHTMSIDSRYQEAMQVFNLSVGAIDEFRVKAEYLNNKLVDVKMVNQLIDSILDIDAGDEISSRKQNNKEQIIELFENGKGNYGQNAWHLYNGVTEWVDHFRGTDNSRINSKLFGSGASIKGKAFDLAMSL